MNHLARSQGQVESILVLIDEECIEKQALRIIEIWTFEEEDDDDNDASAAGNPEPLGPSSSRTMLCDPKQGAHRKGAC